MRDTILKRLAHKKILIAGFGREGKSSLAFIQRFLPDSKVSLADFNEQVFDQLNPTSVIQKIYTGQAYLDQLNEFDLVLKSPGISLANKKISIDKISSQTDLFLEAFHAQVVGITGTKGKSTTASLTHHLLKMAGQQSILTGNIGTPCFDSIDQINPQTRIVFELSAHQLEHIRHSPAIGVILNIFQEHLDHFGTFERYKQAKFNLIRYTEPGDVCIVHESQKKDLPPVQGRIEFFPSMLRARYQLPQSLPGAHNLLNIEAALMATQAAGLDVESALDHLQSFKGLEHRIEFVGKFDGISFYNDSIATIPEAAIAALKTLSPIHYLILGGFDRGIDYSTLVTFLIQYPVEVIFFTGKAGRRITDQLRDAGYTNPLLCFEKLEEVFLQLKSMQRAGKSCLLSPAAASYDQYLNFEQRGQRFKQLATEFGKSG